MNIKILILGANGFFGKNLKFLLKNDKYECVYLDRKQIDVLNQEQLYKKFLIIQPHVVINCCGIVGSSKSNIILEQYDILNTNLQLNMNIINCCKKNNVKKILLFSSYRIFPTSIHENYNETSLSNDINFGINDNNSGYLLSKKIMHLQLELLKQITNMNIICLILPNIFGSYDNFSIDGRIVSSIIYKIKKAQSNNDDIYINSNENISVNLLYINDIVRIIDKCINDDTISGNIIILNKNNTVTLYELCNIIQNIMQYKNTIHYNNNEPYINNNIMNVDLNKFNRHFQNFEFTDLLTSLKQTINHFTMLP
jgi:GDP-L-fucose synthase